MKDTTQKEPQDPFAEIFDPQAFERFDQKNDIFSPANWDDKVRSKRSIEFFDGYSKAVGRVRGADGFSQLDYAFRNASWHVADTLRDLKYESHGRAEGFSHPYTLNGPPADQAYEFSDQAEATAIIKRAAKFFGADDVGVCLYDERWVYQTQFSRRSEGDGKDPPEITDEMTHVIVILEEMDRGLIRTVPSALSGAATGMGYTHDAVNLIALAQFIRNLGYKAHATMNDSALAIPLALAAGLGEYGRHGLLISEKLGPRMRIGKVFTNLPLNIDQPKTFGVKEFCEICDKCSTACPPKAILFEEPRKEPISQSNLRGVTKWTTNAEKCFKFWVNQNSDCSICIRVCPYNRDFRRWYHRLWAKLANSSLRKLALWLDERLRDAERAKASSWWSVDRQQQNHSGKS